MEDTHQENGGNLFTLEIVTPQRSVFTGVVRSFTVPGTMGGFEVLYNHAPLLATIGVGAMKLVTADDSDAIYATSGGFVEVSQNRVVYLADSAERKDEIDIDRAEAAKSRASDRLTEREEGIDLARARAALARALNRLSVAHRA